MTKFYKGFRKHKGKLYPCFAEGFEPYPIGFVITKPDKCGPFVASRTLNAFNHFSLWDVIYRVEGKISKCKRLFGGVNGQIKELKEIDVQWEPVFLDEFEILERVK